jgi:hypothetical protein
MSDTPSQSRRQPATQSQAKARPAERPLERAANESRSGPAAERAVDSKKPQGLQMAAPAVNAGRAGERNITAEKFWVSVEGHLPAGFNVATRPDHGLEVVMEQRSYRKSYSGTGTVKTGLTPIAPIGTPGRLLVTDTTTGETLEQPWTWHRIGGNGRGLWAIIKRLLWKE